MEHGYREPVYTIGIIAKSLRVCTATLRIWERKGLVKPKRLGKNRFYSRCDIERLEHIKQLLQEKHINIEGAREILETIQCWELKKCKPKDRDMCKFYLKYSRGS